MKKYFYIIFGIVYFLSLYILKEWFLNKNITNLINNYINLDKIYYISFIFAIVFLFTNIIETIFTKISKKDGKKSLSKHILPILKKILKIVVWIFWIITIISNLGYNVWALLTWAGIWWLALALASQKTVANIFWAVNVLINRPFEIWDQIKIWNFEWTVEDIWLIYLKLRNTTWHEIMVPNEIITSSVVENFTNKK